MHNDAHKGSLHTTKQQLYYLMLKMLKSIDITLLNILQNSFNAISTKKMTTVSILHCIFYHFKADGALVQIFGNILKFKPPYRVASILSNSHIIQLDWFNPLKCFL